MDDVYIKILDNNSFKIIEREPTDDELINAEDRLIEIIHPKTETYYSGNGEWQLLDVYFRFVIIHLFNEQLLKNKVTLCRYG